MSLITYFEEFEDNENNTINWSEDVNTKKRKQKERPKKSKQKRQKNSTNENCKKEEKCCDDSSCSEEEKKSKKKDCCNDSSCFEEEKKCYDRSNCEKEKKESCDDSCYSEEETKFTNREKTCCDKNCDEEEKKSTKEENCCNEENCCEKENCCDDKSCDGEENKSINEENCCNGENCCKEEKKATEKEKNCCDGFGCEKEQLKKKYNYCEGEKKRSEQGKCKKEKKCCQEKKYKKKKKQKSKRSNYKKPVSREGEKCSLLNNNKEQPQSLELENNNSIKKGNLNILYIKISGMDCAGCIITLESQLKKIGVVSVKASIFSGKAIIEYQQSETLSPEIILNAIKQIKFSGEILTDASTSVISLDLKEWNNPNYEKLIEFINQQNGVINSNIDLKNKIFQINFDADQTGPRTLCELLEINFNHTFTPVISTFNGLANDSEKEKIKWRNYFLISLILCIPVALITFVFNPIPSIGKKLSIRLGGFTVGSLIQFILTIPIQFGIGWTFYQSAWSTLRYTKQANMNLLVMLSTTCAFLYSCITIIIGFINQNYDGEVFFEISSILLTIILLGRYLESIAKKRTNYVLSKLQKLQIPIAILVKDKNEEKEIDINLVQRGDILKIYPGAQIPTDGIVIEGETYINESMITGESHPILKQLGSEVIGGTINHDGNILIRVTKLNSENTLHKIIHLVENAQMMKPNSQKLADKVSAFFVPSIIVLSIITFIVWFCLAKYQIVNSGIHRPETFALLFAISLLVVSCPCAIGLSVPSAILVGSGEAAKRGILFKDSRTLELSHKIDTIVFDKTGTLTKGKLSVHKIYVPSSFNLSEKTLISFVASVENNSEHPVAKAFIEFATENQIPFSSPKDFQSFPGKGIKGTVKNKAKKENGLPKKVDVIVGTLEFMKSSNEINFDKLEELNVNQGANMIIYVSLNNKLMGAIELKDTLRNETKEVITYLQNQNYEIWILSGDHQTVINSIASELNINTKFSCGGMLPEDKMNKIKQLQDEGKIVAMVGDGINDSPSLSQANIGISIANGTDIAIEAADIVLMKENLWDIAQALHISKVTWTKIKFNFLWAFIYNFLAIPLAAGFFYPAKEIRIPPEIAGVSELLSSLPVIISSLLLKFSIKDISKIVPSKQKYLIELKEIIET